MACVETDFWDGKHHDACSLATTQKPRKPTLARPRCCNLSLSTSEIEKKKERKRGDLGLLLLLLSEIYAI
jgi:hypothetical protein